jgi:hypothetical protein
LSGEALFVNSQPTVARKNPTERKWFRRNQYELSIRARIAVLSSLVVLFWLVMAIGGTEDPFGKGFVLALLLISPLDWIIQGWRESAATENR